MKITQVVRYIPCTALVVGSFELGEGSVVLTEDGSMWKWGFDLETNTSAWRPIAIPPLPSPVAIPANSPGLPRQQSRARR